MLRQLNCLSVILAAHGEAKPFAEHVDHIMARAINERPVAKYA
jgi:hypothetical protein